MDTASASLENKPLKGTEEPLDDAFLGPGCDQLATVIKTKQQTDQVMSRLGYVCSSWQITTSASLYQSVSEETL